MRNQEGFTLIELVVVISLLGIFFLVATPKFKDITEVNIKSASRRLTGTIRYLYSEAVFKKKIYKLVFDIDTSEYWVEVVEGNEFVAPSDSFVQREKLPTGVSFKDITTERSLGKTEKGRDEFILFMPTGFVEPAVIHLVTEDGLAYTLATKPYTGGTIVFDEYIDLLKN